MIWTILFILSLVAAVAALAIWRRWIAPWQTVEKMIEDIRSVQKPSTYLIEGSPEARRVGLALEDVFLRQVELSRRADEGEFGVEAIIGAMPDGLVVLDERGGIRVANNTFQRLFGADRIGDGATLLQTLRNAAVTELVESALRTGKAGETQITHSGKGTDRHLAVSAVTMSNGSGAVRGAVILFRDITDLRQADQIRRDFVANVSHELRTPLSIFRGYLEALREEPDITRDEIGRIVEVMDKHSRRLHSLVEDLLSLAQLEGEFPRLQLTDIDLRQFLTSIVHDWDKRLRAKRLDSSLEIASDLYSMRADEARLREIIYNLLDNALKYSAEGGHITISAASENDFTRLSVKDEGIGIPASDLPRIFERFYRVDKGRSRELGGTGLGLSIVKHIAQLHGGDVRAESEPGTGTTIHVLLPRLEGASPPAA